MLRLRFLCAGEGGGEGSPVLFVFCESEWGYSDVSLPPSGVFALSYFRFAFSVSLLFGLRLALSIAPVSCTCFSAPDFLFIVVRCLSSFSLVVVRFIRVFFFPLGVCIFLCLPSLPPP